MPEFSLEFEVYCSCGEGLCMQSEARASRTRGMPQVVVQPCEKCLKTERDKGEESGYEKGYAAKEDELVQ
jgi:hypothetical protein